MKTPLTELIERLEEKKNYHEKGSNFFVALGLAKQMATELLEKEREQIVNSYHLGQMGMIEVLAQATPIPAPDLDDKEDAEQYYNETFKQ